jgi:hypothetical protein
MGSQLTIRGVSADLAERLKALARARGESVNRTALHILKGAAGVNERRGRLERYSTWSADDVKEVLGITSEQRTIDEELWR